MFSIAFCCATRSLCQTSAEHTAEKQLIRLLKRDHWLVSGAIFDAFLALSIMAIGSFSLINMGPKFVTELPFVAKVAIVEGPIIPYLLDTAYVMHRICSTSKQGLKEIKEQQALQNLQFEHDKEKLSAMLDESAAALKILEEKKQQLVNTLQQFRLFKNSFCQNGDEKTQLENKMKYEEIENKLMQSIQTLDERITSLQSSATKTLASKEKIEQLESEYNLVTGKTKNLLKSI